MVRDLDEWKVFQERKEPMRPGENRELLLRVFRLSKMVAADVLMSKYAEFQLRQRITSKGATKDLFRFEHDKNDMVLEVVHNELERIRLETVRHHNLVHTKKTRLLTIEGIIEEKENKIEELKKQIEESKVLLDKRRKKLEKEGKTAKLKHLAVIREAGRGTSSQVEIRDPSPRNISNSSLAMPFSQGMDYFEMDGNYSKEKLKLEGIVAHARRLNRDVRELNSESLDLQRSVSESEAIIRGLRESVRKAKKLKLEFLTVIIKHGLDSRDTGILWIMREIKKLGGDVRSEILPEWIDQHTREFILAKFSKFQKASDIAEWNSFCLAFYKLIVGDQSHSEQILQEIKERLTRNKPNPMANMIAETDSVALNKGAERTATTQPMRKFLSREQLEASLMGDNPFLTDTSVLGVVAVKEEDAVQVMEASNLSMSVPHYQQVAEPPAARQVPRVQLPVSFQEEYSRPDSPSKEGDKSNLMNQSLSKFQSSAALGGQVRVGKRGQSPSQRLLSSKRSQAMSARSLEKKKEFLKKGVVYIGDQQYKFPYGNLFGTELLGSAEASELASQMVSRVVGIDRKKREQVELEQSGAAAEGQFFPTSIDERTARVHSSELTRLQSAVSQSSEVVMTKSEPVEAKSNRLQGNWNQSGFAGFSEFEESDDEDGDPFNTHVKFFDGDRLINRFPSKQGVIKEIAADEEEMLALEEEMRVMEVKEVERVMKIYRRLELEEKSSRYSVGTTTTKAPTGGHVPGVGEIETVLIPHFQNRVVSEYKVDALLYISTFMGYKAAKFQLIRQDKLEQKKKLIQSLKAGKEDKLLQTLLSHRT